MSKFRHHKRIMWVAVWIGVFLACSILTSATFEQVQRFFDIPTPDMSIIESTLVDVADVLGPEWQISVGEGDTPSIRDLQGEYIGVKGAIARYTRNETKRPVFIHQYVTRYISENVAYDRYRAQENWIFSDSVFTDVSPSSSVRNIPLHADDYHLSWVSMDDGDSARHVALLRYQDTIIYVNMWSEWDSTIYLPDDAIESLLLAIDEKMNYQSE